MLPVSQYQLIEKFRALEVQAIQRFIQKKQCRTQDKSRDQEHFLLIAGGQIPDQRIRICCKAEPFDQPCGFCFIPLFLLVSRHHIGQILPEGKIPERVILRKHSITALLKAGIPESHRTVPPADALSLKLLMETRQRLDKSSLTCPVETDQSNRLMFLQLQGEFRQYPFLPVIPCVQIPDR